MGLAMIQHGRAARWVYVIIMWVTVGNGLRYGNRYLYWRGRRGGGEFRLQRCSSALTGTRNRNSAWACWSVWSRCRCTVGPAARA